MTIDCNNKLTNLLTYNLSLGCGCIRVLTLDTIATNSNTRLSTIPNGYGGLNWVNGGLLNVTWERITYGWNGYTTGLTSGIFVGFNSGSLQMTMSVPIGQYFQLNSISLAAAWRNNLALTITATKANAIIYRTVVNLQVASRTTLYTLKWPGIDKVTFDSANGTVYPNLAGTDPHFAFDDIDITI